MPQLFLLMEHAVLFLAHTSGKYSMSVLIICFISFDNAQKVAHVIKKERYEQTNKIYFSKSHKNKKCYLYFFNIRLLRK